MAKKQVAVSLRKPPSPEKIDAFVSSGAPENPSPASERRETSAVDAAQAPLADSTPAAAAAVDAVKPVDSLSIAPTPEPPQVTPVLVGSDGCARRAMTVYLPHPLADRLVLHCIEKDRDMSNLIGEAVEDHLQKQLGPATVGVAQAAHEPPAERASSAPGAPFRSEPFRGEPAGAQAKVDRFLQVGRVLVTLWRQRPWAA